MFQSIHLQCFPQEFVVRWHVHLPQKSCHTCNKLVERRYFKKLLASPVIQEALETIRLDQRYRCILATFLKNVLTHPWSTRSSFCMRQGFRSATSFPDTIIIMAMFSFYKMATKKMAIKEKQSKGSVKGESNTRIYHDISYLYHDPRKREQEDSLGNVLTEQRKRKIELF